MTTTRPTIDQILQPFFADSSTVRVWSVLIDMVTGVQRGREEVRRRQAQAPF